MRTQASGKRTICPTFSTGIRSGYLPLTPGFRPVGQAPHMRLGYYAWRINHAIPRYRARRDRRSGSDHCRRLQAAHAVASSRQDRGAFLGPGSGRWHPVGGVSVGEEHAQGQRCPTGAGGNRAASATESACAHGRRAYAFAATATASTSTAATAAATTTATTATTAAASASSTSALGFRAEPCPRVRWTVFCQAW